MSQQADILVIVQEFQAVGTGYTLGDIFKRLASRIRSDYRAAELKDTEQLWKTWRSRVFQVKEADNTIEFTEDAHDKDIFLDICANCPPLPSPSESFYSSPSSKLLSASDKEAIKKMYNSLDPNKMWTLSTGKIVEKAMKNLALACQYEHSCHSLIMDPEDPTWEKHFTADEIIELATFKAPSLPTPPHDFTQFLSEIKSAALPKACIRLAMAQQFDLDENTTCFWAQTAIMYAAQLFITSVNGIDFNNVSEADLLLLPFNFLTTVFNDSCVNVNSGELTSWESKASMNSKRKVDSISSMERARSGAKVDMLFQSNGVELGCTEAGKRQCMENSTKELKDGWLKQPKTLKDMLYMLSSQRPETTSKLIMVGFTVMGSKIAMSTMNRPAGHVARIVRTRPLFFPNNARQFGNSMAKLLTLAWTGKTLMENTLDAYSTYTESSTDIDFNIVSSSEQRPESSNLHPSFHRSFTSPSKASSTSSKKTRH
ncbi:unnamed protein product [Absidia cylindrospora]